MGRLGRLPRWLIILNLVALAAVGYFIWLSLSATNSGFGSGAVCADVANNMMPMCSPSADAISSSQWAVYLNTAGFGMIILTLGVDAWFALGGFINRVHSRGLLPNLSERTREALRWLNVAALPGLVIFGLLSLSTISCGGVGPCGDVFMTLLFPPFAIAVLISGVAIIIDAAIVLIAVGLRHQPSRNQRGLMIGFVVLVVLLAIAKAFYLL